MADFNKAYEATMSHEGGYSNDFIDTGGETYKGISRKYNGSWSGWVIIDGYKNDNSFPKCLDNADNLQDSVKNFYKVNYWDNFKGDQIIDQNVAEEIFDTGINMGLSRAGKFLQKSLNCLNRNQSLYADISIDGKVGNNTINALNALLNTDDNTVLLKMMNVLQGNHYIEYMGNDPRQERFARGWFSRVELKKKYGKSWKIW